MRFRNEFYFMSNMFPVEIKIGEYTFSCAESAFQAAKCIKPEDKKRFEGLNGFEAKKLGRKVALRPDWNDVRIPLMKRILKIKFSHPDLAEKLMAVKGDIIEENTWHDTFWGVCEGRGENHLGKILMSMREKLLRSEPHAPLCKIEEVKGDLFDAPWNRSNLFVHCVSADFALGAGIAKEFNRRFDMRNRLKKRYHNPQVGKHYTITYTTEERYYHVANLVTKQNYWDKPTYESLRKALESVEVDVHNFGYKSIAMPAIGCGLDRLQWSKVKPIIEDVFKNRDILITVYFL